MVRAVLAQFTVMTRIQSTLGVVCIDVQLLGYVDHDLVGACGGSGMAARSVRLVTAAAMLPPGSTYRITCRSRVTAGAGFALVAGPRRGSLYAIMIDYPEVSPPAIPPAGPAGSWGSLPQMCVSRRTSL